MLVDTKEESSTLLNISNTTEYLHVDQDGNVEVGDLFATLLQIFLTIKLGWLSGQFKVINAQQAKGLDIFVGKYALPVLIFSSLVRLDFSEVDWSFLIGIAVTKAIIFLTVFMTEYFLNVPRQLSRPSIFAILCTQTNDFGMGLPILESVYGPTHKEQQYIGLLYLVGPISLLVLNPIGFTFLEMEKSVKQGHTTKGFKNKIKIFGRICRGLLMNPIVNMTLLGIIGNFAFNKNLPESLDKFLGAIGNTFTSLAPFTLGLNMVGKLNNLRGGSMKTIIGLLVMKGLVTPLLCHIVIEQVGYMLNGQVDPGLSNYGVLYGFIPPALGVDSYASLYNVNPELISGSIVIITVSSAPMMYLSANILKVLKMDGDTLNEDMMNFVKNISSIAMIGVVLIMMIFFVSKRYKRMPHMLTLTLLVFALESSVGGILRSTTDFPKGSIGDYVTVFLSHHGIYSGKLCATILSIVIYFIITDREKLVEKFKILILLLSPMFGGVITIVLIAAFHTGCNVYLNFGSQQDILDLTLDGICLIIMIYFLAKNSRLDEEQRKKSCCDPNAPYPTSACAGKAGVYTPQMFRHFLLLILYSGSLFSNMTLNIFRIATFSQSDSAPGVYKVLVFIDSFLWTGQGLILLVVFALDCTFVLNPMAIFTRWIHTKLSSKEKESNLLTEKV